MVEVILYTRDDCHLCEDVEQELSKLKSEIPHNLSLINVDTSPELRNTYGLKVPVVEIGPYRLEAPIDPKDLKISLMAAQHGEDQNAVIDQAIVDGNLSINLPWTFGDRFSYWLSRNYLAVFNIFVLIYLSLPILAPIFMKVGFERPASWIYRVYGAVCHQLAFRSWFLFGEQAAYPREAANIEELLTYGESTGMDETDLWGARRYVGDDAIGYKTGLCQRDIGIYGGILLFGLVFGLTGRKIKAIPWYLWIIFGILPIGLDGVSQLISQPPLSMLPYRESTPLLRSITGLLFGFITAWFGYPLVEQSMQDTKEYLMGKLERIRKQSVISTGN